MPTVQGIQCDEELHKWRGIGSVSDGVVNIIWAARDPATHLAGWWRDTRSAETQAQIIWSPKKLIIPLDAIMEIPRGTADVRGIKAFSDKHVEDAAGLKEVHVPEHQH